MYYIRRGCPGRVRVIVAIVAMVPTVINAPFLAGAFIASFSRIMEGWSGSERGFGTPSPSSMILTLPNGVPYVKKTEDEFAAQVRGRVERAFHRRAKELGYEVRKVESPAPAEPVEVPTG